MWGMFYKENFNYPELIWEDFAYQIDHKKERKSRRENMPYLLFTKVIINHFLKQHKSLSNLKYQHYYTIKDDGIVSRLKFVRIGEDYQEYGLEISDVMLNDTIKRFESYQMFIKYSTGQIPPKKSRGKGSQDVALELGKCISLTEAEEAEATRKVHATHARIVTESILESTKKKSSGRSYRGVAIQDTLKAANIMQALKESKKISKRQRGIRGSIEGTGTIPGVLDESTIVSATSSEGTGTKPGVSDEEKDITKENFILEWGLEQESEYFEEDQLDDKEKDDKEGDADDKGDDHINEDEEMLNAEAEDSGKGDAEVSDAAKADAEKTEEAKDDSKEAELPPTIGTVKDTTDAEISSLLDFMIQSEVLHIQSPSVLRVPISVISEPTVLTPAQETSSAAPVTNLPLPSISTTPPSPQ
ncbi:hypothetical protein Tco_0739649 [Tanacetum coccineum]